MPRPETSESGTLWARGGRFCVLPISPGRGGDVILNVCFRGRSGRSGGAGYGSMVRRGMTEYGQRTGPLAQRLTESKVTVSTDVLIAVQ